MPMPRSEATNLNTPKNDTRQLSASAHVRAVTPVTRLRFVFNVLAVTALPSEI